jgi:hypothetical protein
VLRAPGCGDLEHVRIDVDKLDTNVGERFEDRRGEAPGSRAEIDDEAAGRNSAVEPVDDPPEHRIVVRDERPNRAVVVVGGHAQMTGDPVFRSHRPRIR